MLKKAFRSPNPALNIYRRNEDVACDIMYSDIPAIFDGSTAAVIFVGTSTKVTDVHGIKDNQFANTLEDNIIQRGAPIRLLSDMGQAIISNKVEDILRTFCIDSWQSEPHQNDNTRPYRILLTEFSIVQVLQHMHGSYVFNTYVTYSIIHIIVLLTTFHLLDLLVLLLT
jgi:hypothetical protein